MNYEIADGRIIMRGSGYPRPLLAALGNTEGKNYWLKAGGVSCLASAYNLALLQEALPELGIPLPNQQAKAEARSLPPRPPWVPRMVNKWYQDEFLAKAEGIKSFALYADMGVGKTKMAIDRAVQLWSGGEIDAVLVIAINGVHKQWEEEGLANHLQEDVPLVSWSWKDGQQPDSIITSAKGKMVWLTINFEGLATPAGRGLVRRFLNIHRPVHCIIDESHKVKNPQAGRWKQCREIRERCPYTILLSGTPIARDLVDYWAQYLLLDEDIIGMKYKVTFKSQFCIESRYKGGFGKSIVGHKNEEKLFALTEPFTYRITKKEALPELGDKGPDCYESIYFEMKPKQRRIFEQMKTQFFAELDDGKYQTAANTAVMLGRLQQITCGHIPAEDGTMMNLQNPRLETLLRVLKDVSERKAIVWCRYTYDIETIMEALGEEAVALYGKTTNKGKARAKATFLDPDSDVRFLVSNPAAAGTGTDGLQTVTSTAIYYSNSFKAVERWQSEDRIHRIGMIAPPTYVDLICRDGVDKRVLKNLKDKKSLSDLMLDDIRRLFL